MFPYIKKELKRVGVNRSVLWLFTDYTYLSLGVEDRLYDYFDQRSYLSGYHIAGSSYNQPIQRGKVIVGSRPCRE